MITTELSPTQQQQRSRRESVMGGGSFIHSHGTKVFMRPRLDGVQDAVAQAKFNEKRWVWIPDEEQAYIRAHIVHEYDKSSNKHKVVEVELENGLTRIVPIGQVYPMNPPKFDRVDDMADLTHLNEPAVIHNLTVRYRANQIYTYSGLFLVAVNPYRHLPIYSDEYIQSYKGRRRGEVVPHIYAVADQAYYDMLQDHENQSILITGESGAGKTENTKIVIQYLAAVASSAGETNQLEQQILQANPILEAFGNAQTIRNNNSSRFGKFIRIEFNMRGQICGANIEWYLLEKSRVHRQAKQERNYHIFYQLLSADEEIKQQLLLGGGKPSDYGFTRDSNPVIEGVDDAAEFKSLMRGLDIMGLSDKEKFDFFRIVAAVLHLGNIVVTPDYRGDRADIRDFASIERVCHLLGVPAQDFKKSLLSPRIQAGRDWVNQAKSPAQVEASLDALAKALYERNFASLVERVNRAIDGQKSVDKMGFIGVLDIAGFEIFKENSFEQLCINYTNEKLQQFFNHNMFVLEQEEYQKEKIDWNYINFGLDLQPTIDLIEYTPSRADVSQKVVDPQPIGILACLEEECVAPHGTDKRFLEKLNKIWDSDDPDSKYKAVRFKEAFIVKHYAGHVEYSTTDWIIKNKDPLNEDITRLLARSTQRHVAKLFEDYLSDSDPLPRCRKGSISAALGDRSNPGSTSTSSFGSSSLASPSSTLALLRLRKGTGSFGTVSQRHKQQLLALMNTLYMTHPHFVRCILPNNRKRAGEIQPQLVLDQLRCNGVLEGIRICRKGFPNRLSFADFRKRYEILCPNLLNPNSFIDGRTACQMLLDHMSLDQEKYRIGTTKVFFKATVLAELEELRDRQLSEYMTGFQAMCRRRIARKHMTRFARQTEAIKVMQRNARIYVTLREWPWWKIYAKLKPLNVTRHHETQIKERDQKIHILETKVQSQEEQIQQLTQRNQLLESQQTDYEDLVQGQQVQVRELQENKATLLAKLTNAEDRLVELAQALEAAQRQIEEAQQENRAQSAMIERLHRDIHECSDDNNKLAQQCESLHSTNETLSARVDYLEHDNKRLSAELQRLQVQHTDHIERLQNDKALRESEKDLKIAALEAQIEKEASEYKHKLKENQSALENAEKTLASRENELRTQEELRRNVEQQCTALEMQLNELKDTLANESEQKRAVQEENQQLRSNWQTLAKLLQEEAVEARARADRLEKILSHLALS